MEHLSLGCLLMDSLLEVSDEWVKGKRREQDMTKVVGSLLMRCFTGAPHPRVDLLKDLSRDLPKIRKGWHS